MPLKKFVPSKPRLSYSRDIKMSLPPLSPGPVLVPVSNSTPPPSGGAFSSAFNNAFDN